ncbi:MAG TPA: ROK family protein [Dermatophilaceae bacterium]
MSKNPSTRAAVPAAGRGEPDSSRRNNLALLLSLLHHHGVLSRAQLTRQSGLNRSTISGLIGQLVRLGLVFETAPSGEQRVGRPSPDVHPNQATAALALNPEVDAVTIGLVGLGGTVIKKIRYEMEHTPTAREAVNIAAAVIAGMRAELDASYRIAGAGIAVPGLVSTADGVVRRAPNLGWENEPIAAMLADATGFPSRAANDASLGAEAELIFGAGAGLRNLIYLNGGASGIGGGIIANGGLLTGAGGYAGELGHTFVRTDGQACHCGASGCLETEVAQSRLFGLLGSSGGEAGQLEEALKASTDPAVRAEVRRQLGYLAIALRNVVNVLNPEAIVLDGFLGAIYALAPQELDLTVAEQPMTEPAVQVRVSRAALGSNLMMIGAAELAFAGLLADPAGYFRPHLPRTASAAPERRT